MVSLDVDGTSLLLQLGIGQLELQAANVAEAETWAEALRMPLPVHEDGQGHNRTSSSLIEEVSLFVSAFVRLKP